MNPAERGAPSPSAPSIGATLLAALAGVLVAFGTFGVLAIFVAAAGLAIGVPLDLAPRDWRQLETVVAAAAAAGAFVAYLFGGYVAGRLGGHDGLRHGMHVFALALFALAVLGLTGLATAGPATIGAHLPAGGAAAAPADGIRIGEVAVKGFTWSLVAMLAGSVIGGILGERGHRWRHPDVPDGGGGRAGSLESWMWRRTGSSAPLSAARRRAERRGRRRRR